MNEASGSPRPAIAALIVQAADEVIEAATTSTSAVRVADRLGHPRPNMNVNEVISNRAIEIAGGDLGSKSPVHPNDHVNMSQSSNDTSPTAMHIAAAQAIVERLLPSVTALRTRSPRGGGVRRHREDRPHPPAGRRALTLGQEFGGTPAARRRRPTAAAALPGLYELALEGPRSAPDSTRLRGSRKPSRRRSPSSPACRS